MTREEAIRCLEICKKYIDKIRASEGVEVSKEVCMALEMAIKALEQEPCDDTVSRGVFEQVMWERDTAIEQLRELGYDLGQKIEPCDDCVSRQALLRKLNTKTHEYSNGMGFRKEWVELINSLSPVIPKREKGEWIKDDFTGLIKCSRCKNDAPISTVSGTQYESNFCQLCGAEMR